MSHPNDLFISRLSSSKISLFQRPVKNENCFCFSERYEVALLLDLGSWDANLEGTLQK